MLDTHSENTASINFDLNSLEIEPEARTQARNSSVEWGATENKRKPIINNDFSLDPDFEPYTASGGRHDLFTNSYEDLPIRVTTIEDGVLFGQEFLVCDRITPTLSIKRLFLVHLPKITDQLDTLEPLTVPTETVYLVGACSPHRNFYHWCFQCLQGIALLRSVARERGLDYKIVLPPLDAPRRRSLELMGIAPAECLTLPPDRFLSGVTLMYSTATCSDYTFQPSQRLISLLDDYRDTCVAESKADLPTRFYLSRRDAPGRRSLQNETELAGALSKHGHSELIMSELSIEDQVSAFANAESIVAPHGAGLVNLMFASPGARLVEIMATNYRCSHFFRLAQLRGMGYSQVLANVVQEGSDDVTHGSLLNVDVPKTISILEQSEAKRSRHKLF